jgi:hypothetical protein
VDKSHIDKRVIAYRLLLHVLSDHTVAVSQWLNVLIDCSMGELQLNVLIDCTVAVCCRVVVNKSLVR